MASNSRIEWTETTWNPLTGCTKVGQGCVHCYAERMARRLKAMGQPAYQDVVTDGGKWTNKVTLLLDKLDEPLTWKKPRRVFVNSMSDLFHKDVPNAFIQAVARVMSNANWHTYQVLTKRYDRPPTVLNAQDAADHIFIGYSVCAEEDAEKAREPLRTLAAMGWRTWVSYEPALERVNWRGWEFIDWLVVGGESGPGAREMRPEWVWAARDWAVANQVPFLFKQWGGVNKKKAGRLLAGREWNEYPERMR